MSTRKATIALPEDLLAAVDEAARERGASRSSFISMILIRALRAKRDATITRQLDELFAGDDVRRAQSESAQGLDDAGSSWSDEDWT